MNRKLYQALAYRIEAAANCAKADNSEWRARHLDIVQALVKEHMPSGSGFDSGTSIYVEDCTADKLVFATSFHHMDEHGGYDGWTDYNVTVRPTFSGIRITVGGRNRGDLKEYIAETFHHALTLDVTN